MLSSACQSFVGDIHLVNKSKYIWHHSHFKDEDSFDLNFKNNKIMQEFREDPTPFEYKCFECQLLHYNKPHFSVRLVCNGLLPIRSLIHEIGLKVNSYAVIDDADLYQQGPIRLNDCLKSYEFHYSCIDASINKHQKLYLDELQKFIPLLPKFSEHHEIL